VIAHVFTLLRTTFLDNGPDPLKVKNSLAIPAQPNRTHGWIQPMFVSAAAYINENQTCRVQNL